MADLEWPDHHHVNATMGWLMLGNVGEARAEFEKLSPASRRRSQALGVEWNLLSREQRWEEAVVTADAQLAATPDDPEPWIHRSFALHELRRTREAFDLLLPAAARFPKESTIPYNLACYTSQLGDLPAARRWFTRALAFGKSPVEKLYRLRAALEDADLQPLWPEFRRRLKDLPARPGSQS
jgi:tetratricopeptide (TPR) repeat protein